MIPFRNPFRIRTSERIDSEELFLRMYGPGILDLLPKDEMWSKLLVMRSAPGGGKTSLLRVFSPETLITLYRNRAADEFRDLYRKLKEIEVVDDTGPSLLSVGVSCARNYASLEDTGLDTIHQERLLNSLLDSRIVLSFLRSALVLQDLRYPEDLRRLKVNLPSKLSHAGRLPLPCDGQALYEWACELERIACEMIDSFLPPTDINFEGHDVPYSLIALDPSSILIDDKPVCKRVLVSLDDVHKLTEKQRINTFRTICELRPQIGVWIAERLEAVSPSQLLALGATEGREYRVINLEDYWRPVAKSKRFESLVYTIADRRVSLSEDFPVGSFAGFLEGSIDEASMSSPFKKSLKTIQARVEDVSKETSVYDNWINAVAEEADNQVSREAAISWRMLEILIERHRQKAQLTLNIPLGREELAEKEKSDVRAAAEFLWSREFKFPYYFGSGRLASLSSSNIEQFLSISAEFFEELSAMQLVRQSPRLNPQRQEFLLNRFASRRWEQIYKTLPQGRAVQNLLEGIGALARSETFRPTAPYAPGVTGIAITMKARDDLINSERKEYKQLASILGTCVAQNLLEPALDRHQGKKGGPTWMILYLNRLLCLKFGLPLQYGGWRPLTLDALVEWSQRVPSSPRREVKVRNV